MTGTAVTISRVCSDQVTSAPSPGSPATDGDPPVPRVSVCVPVYDKGRYLARTLESVLAQTFTDFELVVLDNASTDGSAAVAAAFSDPRIVLVHNESTVPAPQNFRRVVELSSAPLVKVVNADDLIHPTALERQVAVMDADPSLAVVSCRHDLVDDDDAVVARNRVLRTDDLLGRQERAAVIRRVVRHGGNPLGVPGNMLFRRSAYDACGGYPDDPFVLDVGLGVRLVTEGAFFGMPECLSSFRLAVGSVSSSARARNLRLQREFIRGLRREHAAVVRPHDVAFGRLRAPLTWLRHHLLMSASSAPGSPVQRMTSLVLDPRRALGRGSSAPPA